MTLLRTPTTRARRTGLALLASAATAAGLVLTAIPSQAAVDAQTVSGTTNGAAWTIKVPTNWNHTLLLWNHGIRTTLDPNRNAEWAPKGTDGDTAETLLGKGYALAGSGYRSNGWAVRDGVNDDVALLSTFAAKFGKPSRTYVWGASLGGLVTETLAEERPDLVTGAAPACGVLAGAVPIFDQTLDSLLMVRAMFRPTLKITGYATDAEAAHAGDLLKGSVMGALSNPATQAGAVGRIVAIAVLQGLPLQTKNFNGKSTASQAGAAAEGVLTQAVAALVNFRDTVARTGGIAATNVGTSYAARVTPEAVAQFKTVGLSKDLLTSYAATLDRRVGRLAASPTARAKARTLGAPTGKVKRPTVTMHTAYDQFVTAANESLFAKRVAAAGTGASVLQLFVTPPAYADAGATTGPGAPYGAGHCTFTAGEWLSLLSTLDAFVAAHAKPSSAAVAALWTGVPGLNQTFTPLPWRGTSF